jgi:hypothetical protein
MVGNEAFYRTLRWWSHVYKLKIFISSWHWIHETCISVDYNTTRKFSCDKRWQWFSIHLYSCRDERHVLIFMEHPLLIWKTKSELMFYQKLKDNTNWISEIWFAFIYTLYFWSTKRKSFTPWCSFVK